MSITDLPDYRWRGPITVTEAVLPKVPGITVGLVIPKKGLPQEVTKAVTVIPVNAVRMKLPH